ncbi:MAG: dipeptidase PepV, partial [Armatimonadota bacterium]|nr:dipeptidase PepV [Armatimonadota bacterium]
VDNDRAYHPSESSRVNNFSQIDSQVSEWIEAHRAEIVETTQALLRIPSVEGDPALSAPFGMETRQALDYALSVAETHGLTPKNLDGYAAHAEWAAPGVAPDAPIVGVLAHVDVVPAGEGWSHPPFEAGIANGRIYARGISDDKGPAMAALWAILAVKECAVPLTHRIRLILGANEESGFGCVKHYFAHEEMPVTGFTPDGMFPLVYAEKGIANAVLTRPAPSEGERMHIRRLSGGQRPNMVPETAEAVLENPSPRAAVIARLNSVVGIQTEEMEDGALRVVAKGVSAHGSTPEAGVNAVAVLFDALLLLDHQEDQVRLIEHIRTWAADTTGGTLGIAGQDEVAGPLTSNLGLLALENGQVSLTFNIRYPVTWNSEALRARLEECIAGSRWSLQSLSDQPPLYVPLDDPLVATLLQVYRDETGDETPPLTMGGGTYARSMQKGVAFGPSFRDADPSDGGAHAKDECWPIAHLIRATKIYARALARLASE